MWNKVQECRQNIAPTTYIPIFAFLIPKYFNEKLHINQRLIEIQDARNAMKQQVNNLQTKD